MRRRLSFFFEETYAVPDTSTVGAYNTQARLRQPRPRFYLTTPQVRVSTRSKNVERRLGRLQTFSPLLDHADSSIAYVVSTSKNTRYTAPVSTFNRRCRQFRNVPGFACILQYREPILNFFQEEAFYANRPLVLDKCPSTSAAKT